MCSDKIPYTKIGRFVTCYGSIILTSKGSNTGGFAITNLPFTVADILSGTALEGGGLMTYHSGTSGIYGSITVLPAQSSTDCTLYGATDTDGNMGGVTNTNITNNSEFRFAFTYQT